MFKLVYKGPELGSDPMPICAGEAAHTMRCSSSPSTHPIRSSGTCPPEAVACLLECNTMQSLSYLSFKHRLKGKWACYTAVLLARTKHTTPLCQHALHPSSACGRLAALTT